MKRFKNLLFPIAILATVSLTLASPTITTLDNGMEVMLVENHGNPVIASVIVVRTGARNETVELNGATHFLEHLLFNGTETRTQKQLYDEMDFLGGYNNANTAQDRTTFMILLEKSNFEQGLEIQADMLFYSTLPAEKFVKEKGIVIEEIGKDEDSEDYRAGRFFDQALFSGTPYQWPILGSRQSIGRLTREQVWAYYKQYYVPNNMVALITGDFQTAEMLKVVERVLGQEPPGSLPPAVTIAPTALSRAQETRGELFVNQGAAAHHHIRLSLPAPTRFSADYFPFTIMVRTLGERLDQELKAAPDLGVAEVSVSHFVDRDLGILNVDVAVDPAKDYQPVLEQFHRSAMAFLQESVSPGRIAGAVTAARAEETFNAERPHYYGMMKAEDLAQGGAYFVADYAARLAAVKPEDVKRVTERYLGASYPLVAIYQALPAGSAQGAEPQSQNALRQQFDNGLVAIAEENQDSKVFAAHLLFKNRSADEIALGAKPGAVDFIHHLFDQGPDGMGQESFQAELQRLGAQTKFYDMAFIPYDDYYTTPEYSYIRVEALDENFAAVLDLVSRTVMLPSFAPEAIEATRGQMTGLARRNQGSVQESGRALFKKLMYGDSYLAGSITGSAADIGAFTAEDLRRFHDGYFGPGNLVLTIVTSNKADSVMAQVGRTLGSWPAAKVLPEIPKVRPQAAPTRGEQPGGKEQSYLAMGYIFDVVNPADRAPLAILNAIVSDRMQFQLREKEGLAYTLGSSVSFSGGWGIWAATMGTGPQNLPRAEAGIIEQVRRAAHEKFTKLDVEKARNAYLGRQMLRYLSRINQAYQMGLGEFSGEGAESYRHWTESLKKVGEQDVTRVAKEYLRSEGMTVAIIK